MSGYKYHDDCVNCGAPVMGEFIGVLATGPLISWRHAGSYTFGCDHRVDRRAPQALPASEADAVCTVHRQVTHSHYCEAGGTAVLKPDAVIPGADGFTCAYRHNGA